MAGEYRVSLDVRRYVKQAESQGLKDISILYFSQGKRSKMGELFQSFQLVGGKKKHGEISQFHLMVRENFWEKLDLQHWLFVFLGRRGVCNAPQLKPRRIHQDGWWFPYM